MVPYTVSSELRFYVYLHAESLGKRAMRGHHMGRTEAASVSRGRATCSEQEGHVHRLQGAPLALARAVWLAVVVPAYALLVTNLPAYVSSLSHVQSPVNPVASGGALSVQPTPANIQLLRTLGISLGSYVVCMLAVTLVFELSYASVGLLLFWRRADDRAALLCSFALLLLPLAFAIVTVPASPFGWRWVLPTLGAVGNASLLLCALVFPDGRVVPARAGWLVPPVLAFWALVAIFPTWALDRSGLSLALFLGMALGALLLQLYRYRAVSTPHQRQQTQWALYGISIAVLGNIAPRLLYTLILAHRWGASGLAYAVEIGLVMGALVAIPLTVGGAMLATRLWDIELLLNRTLVYGTLTASLLVVYSVCVIGFQAAVTALTGARSLPDVVVVASTLVIAALFNPLRRRLQANIDHRFFRRKYDAAQALANFAGSLRREVDLSELGARLVGVVKETMEPTAVSLWLRSSSAAIESTDEQSRAPTHGQTGFTRHTLHQPSADPQSGDDPPRRPASVSSTPSGNGWER